MHSNVRDYIVNGDRLKTILKDYKDKKVYGQNYLLRIRTKYPQEIGSALFNQ